MKTMQVTAQTNLRLSEQAYKTAHKSCKFCSTGKNHQVVSTYEEKKITTKVNKDTKEEQKEDK